jgi:D-glycero-D-manno-heptose 1,7-bisphosphate phosphatase
VARAVFLDRDGVINSLVLRGGRPVSPRLLSDFSLEEGVRVTLERLRDAGFRLFVVTNQPDVARGMLSLQLLAQMNEQVMSQLPIERVVVCPHDDYHQCRCRKPRPGMIEELAAETNIELSGSFVIGDSWRDVQAARACGCVGIILDRYYNRNDDADYRVGNIAEAARLILQYGSIHER